MVGGIEANGTRWNSLYQAANRFLVLKDRISKSWKEWNTPNGAGTGLNEADFLNPYDWEELELTHGAVEVFDGTAMADEGHAIFLSDWLSAMNELMD
ncbi:hypothetical protein E4U23_005764 [Claviceps purpurea]|nr:hypothetical protein E4U23_005764 [Claviceps purpurea]